MRFVRRYSTVEALPFDGTRESALAIVAAFPNVARSVSEDDVLVVPASFGHAELRAGQWVVRDFVSRALRVWDGDDFHEAHEPVS